MKLKKVLLTTVAGLGLICAVNFVQIQQVNADIDVNTITKVPTKDIKFPDTPKALRGTWYCPGCPKLKVTKNGQSIKEWGMLGRVIDARWDKLSNGGYSLWVQEIAVEKHNGKLAIMKDEDGNLMSASGSITYFVKNVSYKGKKYKVLLAQTVPTDWLEPRFNHRVSRKTGKKLLKKCHLSKKSLKINIEGMD